MKSGRTLWDELCLRYEKGVESVSWLQDEWNSVKSQVDSERFEDVSARLVKQERDAKIWRDACILYFQTFSGLPIPDGVPSPDHDLQYYMNYRYTDIPGISRR